MGSTDMQNEDNSGELILSLPHKAQRFIHLYMTGQYSLSKLAQLLEVHPNTLHNWLRRRDVQEVIQEMQKSTHDMVSTKLKALTVQAINRLAELTNSPIDGVALQAVKDILDRAGHKQKTEIKVDKTVTTVEEKMQKLINNTLDEEEIIEDGQYEMVEEAEEDNDQEDD